MAKRSANRQSATARKKANVKTNTGGSRPGSKDESAAKPKKVVHPLVDSDDPDVYPFKEIPDDFDSSKHKPLKKKDFASEATYFDMKAAEYETKAEEFRAKAEEARTLGDKETRQAANRLKKVQKTMLELVGRLKKQDVDVAAVLKAQGIDEDAAQGLLGALAEMEGDEEEEENED